MFRNKAELETRLADLSLSIGEGVPETVRYTDVRGVEHVGAWHNAPVTITRRGRVYPLGEIVFYDNGGVSIWADYRIKHQDTIKFRELLARAGYSPYSMSNAGLFTLVQGTD